MTEIDIANV